MSQVLVADHLLPFPQMHLGHKGIFIDRLDAAVVDSAANESPRLVPFGHTICHNRNRLYSPQLGRFFQLDPNATAMALLEASVYHGKGVGALALAFSAEDMYGDGMNLYEYLGSNPWNRSDPLGLSWDPFDMVDEFLAEDAGSKAAFMQAIGMSAKATAVLAATIASYLPIPGLASAGDLALFALGEQGAGATAVALGMGIIPGGKLAKLFATSKIGKLLGGVASSAWNGAKHYASKAGAMLLSGARNGLLGPGGTMLARAADWIKRKPAAACGCFAAGTLVWTTLGQIPIEDVRIGDQVITLNESTGAIEFQPVVDMIVTEQTSLLRVAVIHESGHREVIDTTDEHPFYEEARVGSWIRADSLAAGDVIRTMGGAAVVDSLSFWSQRVTVYNLTVDNAHTYLVGDEAAWVHNMKCAELPDWITKKFTNPGKIEYHWQKHAEKHGKSLEEYMNDAIAFFNTNRYSKEAFEVTSEVGRAIKIKGKPGGIFAPDGRIITFWYD
ncbi:MAG: Hint domain-containing protein [Phycisphaeraceae bacterium]|nr:MAG: Hint domain-containing protein [Phycisphaeraceae bacterium]